MYNQSSLLSLKQIRQIIFTFAVVMSCNLWATTNPPVNIHTRTGTTLADITSSGRLYEVYYTPNSSTTDGKLSMGTYGSTNYATEAVDGWFNIGPTGNTGSTGTATTLGEFNTPTSVRYYRLRGQAQANYQIVIQVQGYLSVSSLYKTVTSSIEVEKWNGSAYEAYSPTITTSAINGSHYRKNATLNSADQYRITFTATTTGTTNNDFLGFSLEVPTVCTAPAINTQPSVAGQSVSQGSSTTALSVTATGTDLSYQWYSSTDASNATTGDDIAVGSNSNSHSPSSASTGTLYYFCTITGSCGNITSDVSGAIEITAYVTPAPTISSPSNKNQGTKGGNILNTITFSLTNSTGANVTGLPTGLTGLYDAGTFVISGTVDAGVTAGSYPYTVTATALEGYAGSPVTETGTILVKSASATSVLYLVASTVPATDMLYPYLDAKSELYLTIKAAGSTAPDPTIYNSYDLIIIHESVSSTNVELVALKTVNKPILNFKSYVYNSGRWAWGAADNGFATNTAVTVKQPSHPVFNGISGETPELLSAVDASKGIQPADITLAGSICLATAPKTTGTTAIAIHDVPASVRGVSSARYLLIPIAAGSYQYITNTTKTLVDNAVEYLLHGTQFTAPDLKISSFNIGDKTGIINHDSSTILVNMTTGSNISALQPVITLTGTGTTVSPLSGAVTDFSTSMSTPVLYTVTDGINSKTYEVKVNNGPYSGVEDLKLIQFDGMNILNRENKTIQVYTVTGKMLISSLSDINLSEVPNGIYVVKISNEIYKISVIH